MRSEGIQSGKNKIIGTHVLIHQGLISLLFIILLALSAYIKIPTPFSPVPLTMQTLVVLLAGGILGAKRGAIVTVSYILIGMAGFPVFAGNLSGLTGLTGPTGGYLVGFVAAALFTGWATAKVRRNYSFILAVTLIASGLILILGGLHLSIFLNTGIQKAFFVGILPFIPGDILKSAIAAGIMYKYKN